MKLSTALIGLLSSSLLIGCMPESSTSDESFDQSTDALVTTNSISINSISINSISLNSISTNSISTNSISTNALSVIREPGEDGESARTYLRYLVLCSFKKTQSVSFTWTDESDLVHHETFFGQLGLAPEWATGPVSLRGRQWVSGCMAAHVNYYGVHVTVSVRSGEEPLRLHPNSAELDDYSHVEGAFWGDLWAPTPYLNTCFNAGNATHSRDLFRDCAAGHVNSDGSIEQCGLINIAGSCANVCKKYNASRGYYEDCRKQPGVNNQRTDRVITTALPD